MTDFISVEKVYGILDAAITPISRKERLPLRDALGCVLAESLYATNDVPAFNNSAMDGFAFPGSSLPAHGLARLPVEGVSYAGVPYCSEYSPRTALRVMTGAAVPEGADTVIPFEHVRETTDDAGQTWIEFPHDEVKPGANLRLKGEEMKAGSIVMPAGLVLTPEWIGMAASLGHAELLVRRIRVAVFSTGDELAAPGTPGPLDTGRIYNANSPLIAALAQSWGAQVEDLGILPDNPEAIRSAFLDLGSRVDFIVTSGGVGEGEHDYTSKVFAELGGELSHHHISQRPGKPFSFGRLGEAGPWFIALPGNPVAAAVSAKLYLHRAVRLAAGALSDEIGGKVVPARALSRVKGRTGRTDIVRGHLEPQGEVLTFTPAGSQGSAMLSTLAGMNATAVLPEDTASAEAGSFVECLLL